MKRTGLFLLMALMLSACTAENGIMRPSLGSIKGTVRDSRSMRPLPNAQVYTWPGTSLVVSNDSGVYHVDDVTPGDYVLNADYVDTILVATAAIPVNVGANSAITVDLNLNEGRSQIRWIQGQVVDENGKPVAGASVTTEPISKQATSGADGRFFLFDVRPEYYKITARFNQLIGSTAVDMNGSTCAKAYIALSLQDMTLGWLRGKILSRGQPLSGVKVSIDSLPHEGSTELDGTFMIRNVPIGNRTVSLFANGYKTLKIQSLISAGVGTSVDTTLPEMGNVSQQGLELYVPFTNSYDDASPKKRAMRYLSGELTSDRFGHENSALEISGSGGVETVSGDGLNLLPITIGAWFFVRDGDIKLNLLLGKMFYPTGEGYYFMINNNNIYLWYEKKKGKYTFITTGPLSAVPRNTWFWVGLSINAEGSGYGLINGKGVIYTTWGNEYRKLGPVVNNDNFRIGSLQSTESWGGLRGKVDHVVIYNRFMTISEFISNMEEGE